MIKHIVLWKLKPEMVATKDIYQKNIAQIRENYRVLRKKVPEIVKLELFETVKHGKDIYEFGAAMEFASLEALESFQRSDAHKEPAAKAFCDSVRECKAVIDYEIAE